MDWISSRELAVIIGIIGSVLSILAIPSMRKHMYSLLSAATQRQLLFLLVCIVCSVGFTLFLFEPTIGWTSRQLWLSLLWIITIGLPITARVTQRIHEASWDIVLDEVSNKLSLTLLLSILASYRSFSLLLEITIVLLFTILILYVLSSIRGATASEQDRLVALPMKIGAVFGVVFLTLSITSIYKKPEQFFRGETAIDFVLPFVLTASFVVFTSLLFLYVTYYDAFVRIGLYIRDDKLRTYARWKAVVLLNINVKAVKRWLRVLALGRPETRTDVDRSILSARSTAEENDVGA